jgi:ABC-type glycerol-3-phosphate transport system permease component
MKTEASSQEERGLLGNGCPSPQNQVVEVIGRGLFWLLVLVIVFYTMAPFVYAISISFAPTQVLVEALSARRPEILNYQNLFGIRTSCARCSTRQWWRP